jgi:TetR/AcrR family transcriptional repressor of lmrAB and yxaGH operons
VTTDTRDTHDTRQRMLHTTAKLLRQQGYHGTGLNQIVAEADAPKGSMYFHFPGGKAQLAAESLDYFADRVIGRMGALIAEKGNAADAVVEYLTAAAAGFEKVGYGGGCALATVSAEAAPSEPLLAAATGRAFLAWIKMLAKDLEREGHDPDEADRRATAAIALIEGAIVMTRGMQNAEPLLDCRDAARLILAPPA